MASFAIKDIKPNPYRHLERYPIKREKVEALRESYRKTGWWGNIVARLKDGKPEIAYGHHRLIALKEEMGANEQVDLIIRKLDNEHMIQIMVRENMEEWGTIASIEHENIRAAVEAYAAGEINFPVPDPSSKKSYIRYAPSFIPGEPPAPTVGARPYTAQTLAEFLGYLKPGSRHEPQDKVHDGLTALQFIQEGLLKESDLDGLSGEQASAVLGEARKAKERRESTARIHHNQAAEAERAAKQAEKEQEEAERERERMKARAAAAKDAEVRRKALEQADQHAKERRQAEETRKRALERQRMEQEKERAANAEARRRATLVGRTVSTQIKSGKIGYRQAADAAFKVDTPSAPRTLPDIEDFAKRLASDLGTILDETRDPRVKRLQQLIEFRKHLDPITLADFARTLEKVSERALSYAKRFEVKSTKSENGRNQLALTNK